MTRAAIIESFGGLLAFSQAVPQGQSNLVPAKLLPLKATLALWSANNRHPKP